MIIDPDFLDHWRTRMLVDLLGDEMAPLYLIRIWSHLQENKITSLPAINRELAGICGYEKSARNLREALISTDYMVCDYRKFLFPNWEAKNRRIIASWTAGRLLDVSDSEWGRLRAEVFNRDNRTCVYCGATDCDLECDHVFPVSKGGKSYPENLATSCVPCNRSKGPKTVSEWRGC